MENRKSVKNTKENVISESELKTIAKFVLNEIAPKKNSKHPMKQMFSNIQQMLQTQQDQNPISNDINVAKKTNDDLIVTLRRNINDLFIATYNKDKQKFQEASRALHFNRDDYFYVTSLWATKIFDHDESMGSEVHRIMEEIRTHTFEIANIASEIIEDIKKYKNYINAVKKARYINEIFNLLKKDSQSLFDMATKLGLGKGK